MSEPSDDDLVHAGWRLVEAGNARGAITQLTSVLARAPQHVNGLTALTQAYLNLGDIAQAQSTASALLRAAPNAAAAHRLQAEIYRRQSKVYDALPEARMAVKLDPNNVLSYHILGMTEIQAKDYKAAIKTSDAGLQVAPASAILLAQKARAVFELEGAKTAEPFADEALRFAPTETFVLRNAARIAIARGNLERAKDLLTSVLRRNANDEEAVTLYLLTNPNRHGFVRAASQFNNWRREHGVWGAIAWVSSFAGLIIVALAVAAVCNVPGVLVGLGFRFFMRAQYADHRREVKAHFAQSALKASF